MSSSFNMELPIVTGMLFFAGTAYYIYKYINVRQNFNSGTMNRNQEGGRNYWEQEMLNSDQSYGNEDVINIFILYKTSRTSFRVRRNEIISSFIEKLRRQLMIPIEHNISLFCQGRRLEARKALNEYVFITNDTNLHCFSILGSQSQPQENTNVYEHDENAVHFQTLLFHGMVLILVIGLIFSYNSCKELFTKSSLNILKILIFFWTLAFSKCIAKLLIHKKIVYN